ncbi:MAG: chemotaxis protein MotB [Roseivirga sp.]|jgi:chemotaxis protein MotB
MNLKTPLLLLLILSMLSSCVAKKEFDVLMTQKNGLENDKTRLENDLAVANEKISRLEVQLDALKNEKISLQNDFNVIDKELKELRSEFGRIKGLYDNLLTNSGQLNSDLARQQQRLLTIEDDLEIQKKKNEELAIDLAKRESRVAELEKIIADKEAAVQALKNKVTNALLNFNEDDLKVEVRNGKVYVSLAEQLLFKSASIQVDQKGVNALKQLAGAIKSNPDINIMVEGHTDNVQFTRKVQYMSDNWDLSVLRATSIVRILTEGGVSATSITASGKGESSPLVANDSPENKAKNRRTEIILTPKLDELFKLLESN